MRTRLMILGVVGLLAIPALAWAQSRPSWCGGGGGGGGGATRCARAYSGFSGALAHRFGAAWTDAAPRLESCPQGNGGSPVHCLAYFRYRGTYHFVNGTVSQSQATLGAAHYYANTTWHRRWRRCSLAQPRGAPVASIPGRLEANEPCEALPLEATYTVGDEMMGSEGSVHYEHIVGWQFTDSAYFANGMKPVELATCRYRRPTITCSDREGDSLRYTY